MVELAVSAFTLSELSLSDAVNELQQNSISGIEVAPSLFLPDWPFGSLKKAKTLFRSLRDEDIRVSGIQSIFYGQPEFQLMNRDSWGKGRTHLMKVMDLACLLDSRVLVFGSPNCRRVFGSDRAEVMNYCIDFFSSIKEELEKRQVVLTLEPNPPDYGSEIMTSYRDAAAVVASISSPWIACQLDTGCQSMVGESAAASVSLAAPAHVHVSAENQDLLPGNLRHEEVRESLIESGYDGWLVLETGINKVKDLSELRRQLSWFVETYSYELKQESE